MSDLRFPVPPPDELCVSTQRIIPGVGTTSPVGLGCWRLTGAHSNNVALLTHARDLGITFIDNADVYGLDWGGSHFGACEEALGQVLADVPGLRNDIILATKAGIVPGVPYNSSASYLIEACEASLHRLGVDHIDLFQIHRPDVFTHPEEVASALLQLQQRGLIRACGVSNYSASQTLALQKYLGDALVTIQPEFSALHLHPLRDGTLDVCQQEKLTPLAWSPLAGGRISSGDGVSPELLSTLDTLATEHEVSREAIAIAFVLSHPSRPIALIGSQQPHRLTDCATALTVSLSREDVYNIVQASDGVPLP
ncbi:MAG: aldo/keto reductase [Ilumatobacteraceae bacterium]